MVTVKDEQFKTEEWCRVSETAVALTDNSKRRRSITEAGRATDEADERMEAFTEAQQGPQPMTEHGDEAMRSH